MNAYLQHTGKSITPNAATSHGIKATVNGSTRTFTVADNEKCSFGLYDQSNRLLGYIQQRGTVNSYSTSAAINGSWEITVRDAPAGAYVSPIESFYLNAFGGVTKYYH